jgi:uncharacterized protein YjbJ (UPF0337 family)
LELDAAMSVDRSVGSAKMGAGHVLDAVGGLLGDRSMQAKGMVDEAVGSAQLAYGQVEDVVRGSLHDAVGMSRKARGELQDLVSERPVLAAGVALAVGLLLAMLVLGASRTARA